MPTKLYRSICIIVCKKHSNIPLIECLATVGARDMGRPAARGIGVLRRWGGTVQGKKGIIMNMP